MVQTLGARPRAALGAWLVAAAFALHVEPVSAQRGSVAVLGLATEDGDDERAAAITAALRDQVQADASAQLSSSRALLSQMTLLQDCEIAEADCRTQIGEALEVDTVIYGWLRREGPRAHVVDLRMFQTRDGSEVAARRTIPVSDADAALAQHARALLTALHGRPEPARAPSAPEDSAGAPPIASVTPDVAPLEQERDASVVDAGAVPEDTAAPSNDWLGYSLLGLAAVSAGLTVFSWTQIESANEDLVEYRNAVWQDEPRIEDVCTEAEANQSHGFDPARLSEVRDTCAQGQTFEVLQYVFLGAALVGGGVGTYLLLDGDGDGADRAARRSPAVSLRAHAGPRAGLVSVRVRM